MRYFQPQDRGIPTDEKLKDMMQTSLQLRLSLVGSMFDTIQRSNGLTQDWAFLLSQVSSAPCVIPTAGGVKPYIPTQIHEKDCGHMQSQS